MRGRGPPISSRRTWERWQAFFTECVLRALNKLREIDRLPEGENALNSKLLDCLRIAAKEIRPTGNYPLIRAECPPLPYGQSEETSRRLKATPDFVWGYVDYSEPDALRNAREFTIECKRLRQASASWNYNESYVEDGIKRFLDTAKNYGIGVSSGVMIGYWQAMDADGVLQEVNAAAEAWSIPILILGGNGWQLASISKLNHSLIRTFPISPFQLEHFWVDLRGNYKT